LKLKRAGLCGSPLERGEGVCPFCRGLKNHVISNRSFSGEKTLQTDIGVNALTLPQGSSLVVNRTGRQRTIFKPLPNHKGDPCGSTLAILVNIFAFCNNQLFVLLLYFGYICVLFISFVINNYAG